MRLAALRSHAVRGKEVTPRVIQQGAVGRVVGVESADHPTDGVLLDHARRYFLAADRMRPQRA